MEDSPSGFFTVKEDPPYCERRVSKKFQPSVYLREAKNSKPRLV